jgi:hypothetical protein
MTEASPISRFPVPDLARMPELFGTASSPCRRTQDFIPNVFLVLAHRPDEFRAFRVS